MMSVTSLKTVTILALVLVFATDALTPLGFAHGMLYTPVLIMTLFVGSRLWLFWIGTVSFVLILAGTYFSVNAEVPPGVYWPNRLISLTLLVTTGILLDSMMAVLKSRRLTIEKLQAAQLKLEQKQVLMDIASQLGHLGGWSYDALEGKLDWSPEIFRIHGFSPGTPVPSVDEAIGLYGRDEQPVLRNHFERCVNEGMPFDFETEVHTIAETLIPVRVQGRPLYRGKEIVGVQGAFQDLSDYKKLEQSAHYRQRLFSELTESLPIVIWMADDQGQVDFVNQALAHYTGVAVETMNLPMGWIDLLHPEDQERTIAIWQNAVEKHQAYTTEFRIRRYDGHFGHFLVSAQPVDHPGEGSRWYGTATDMDEYRLLQEQLHQARRLESIGHLTGGLAHDFNNLLTVVTGNAGLLRDLLSDRPQAQEMPGGGTLQLHVYCVNDEVVFGARNPAARADWLIIEMADSGHGMDEATQARVYEPFFTTKNPGRGTGLGLSQVFGFVTQSGGEVQLRSEPGGGTRVRLCFPVVGMAV